MSIARLGPTLAKLNALIVSEGSMEIAQCMDHFATNVVTEIDEVHMVKQITKFPMLPTFCFVTC